MPMAGFQLLENCNWQAFPMLLAVTEQNDSALQDTDQAHPIEDAKPALLDNTKKDMGTLPAHLCYDRGLFDAERDTDPEESSLWS